MPIMINGETKIKTLYADEVKQKKCYVNEDNLVYSADETLIDQGGNLSEEATLYNFSKRGASPSDGYPNCYEFRLGIQYYDSETTKEGYIEFDFTDYDRIDMSYVLNGWARYADMDAYLGIDKNYTRVGGEIYITDPAAQKFATWDISEMTGTHKIWFKCHINNKSSDTTSLNIGFIIKNLSIYA